jgi:hypothetical protein
MHGWISSGSHGQHRCRNRYPCAATARLSLQLLDLAGRRTTPRGKQNPQCFSGPPLSGPYTQLQAVIQYVLDIYYSFRFILLFDNTDISTTKISLDTSILVKSIIDRESIQFLHESSACYFLLEAASACMVPVGSSSVVTWAGFGMEDLSVAHLPSCDAMTMVDLYSSIHPLVAEWPPALQLANR